MDDRYSIYPPEVVRMEQNHPPPSPLSSAPNTPTSDSRQQHSKNFQLSDSENDTDREEHIKGPPRVSRQLLPPSVRSPNFSKLPSAVMNPNSGRISVSGGSEGKAKRKPFMKKSDVPFDEGGLTVPKLSFSSTERALRMVKGETVVREEKKVDLSHKPSPYGNSHHYAPDDEISPTKSNRSRRSHHTATEDEGPEDERNGGMLSNRNILAEMDEMEDFIAHSRSSESEGKDKHKGVPTEITLDAPKSGSKSEEKDELMKSVPRKTLSATDEILGTSKSMKIIDVESSPRRHPCEDELMRSKPEVTNGDHFVTNINGDSEPLEEPTSEIRSIMSKAATQGYRGKTYPPKQPSAATSAPPSAAQIALACFSPQVIDLVDDGDYTSLKQARMTEEKLNALDHAMDRSTDADDSFARLQEEISKDMDIQSKLEENVSFNMIMDDATYFSQVAATALAAAGSTLAANLESIVMGSPRKTKTPEQMAAEWRHRKQQAATQARSDLVYNPGQYALLTETAFSRSEDSDDRTEKVDNRLIDDLKDGNTHDLDDLLGPLPPPSVSSPLPEQTKVREDGAGQAPPPSTPSRVTSSSSGVTGWWLEKELARRDRQQKVKAGATKSTDELLAEARRSTAAIEKRPDEEIFPSESTGKSEKPLVLSGTTATVSFENVDLPDDEKASKKPNDHPGPSKAEESSKRTGVVIQDVKNSGENLELAPVPETAEDAEKRAFSPDSVVDEAAVKGDSRNAENVVSAHTEVKQLESPCNEDAENASCKETAHSALASTDDEEAQELIVGSTDSELGQQDNSEPNHGALKCEMELPKEQEFEILPADEHAAQAIDIDVTMDHSDNPQGVDATIVVAPDGLGSSQGTESPRDKEKSKGPATFPRKSQNLLGEASIEQNLSMNLDVVGDDVDRSAEELYKDSQVDVTENTRKLEQIEEIVVSGGSPAKDSDISPEGDVSEEVDSSVAEHSRHASEAVSIASEGTMVLSNKAPKMVKALDDVNGICKGDILISLVHCKESDGSGSPKGSVQIRDAVWRMRAMRRRFACIEIGQIPSKSTSLTDSPSKVSPTRNGRRSLPVDVDNMRVVDSMAQTRALEEGVVDHLHHDEFEDAIDLCKEIVSAYEDSFKQKEQHRSEEGNGRNSRLDSKPFFGNALHNMGIIYLLKQNYKRALSCFEGAAENRQPNDETPNSDYLTTLVKISLCNYALEDFSKAHKGLESCLESAKGYCKTITDFVQVAEILNNLGCLYFMCSQPETAARLFKESLDVQQSLLSHSLYGGSVLAGNASTLNMSVTRGNMAFLCMCANDHASAIFGLERALAAQQALLFDEHETLIGTMDHLAAANVLGGNKDKAISMLERMLRAQIHAYGSSDRRCDNTRSKIRMVMSKIGSRSGAELSTFIETINRQSPVVKQQAQPKSGKPRLLQKLSSSLRKKQ